MKIPKDLIVFISVLVAISVLFGLGKLSQGNFMKILLLMIGGITGWRMGYERGFRKGLEFRIK